MNIINIKYAMKKYIKTAVLTIFAVIVLGGIYAVYAEFNGSILKKAVLTYKAEEYVSKHYGEDYSVEYAVFNFKFDDYYCRVRSDKSIDTEFDVFEDSDGIVTDDHEFRVNGRDNTYRRLESEIGIIAGNEFLTAYPYKCILCICKFKDEDVQDLSKLELDMKPDMHEPPFPMELTLWAECEEPSWEELAKALYEAVNTVERLGWNIAYYSIKLYYPVDEDNEKPASAMTKFNSEDIMPDMIKGYDCAGLAGYLESQASQ